MADINSIIVKIEADLDNLKAGLSEGSTSIKKFSGNVNNNTSSMLRNFNAANRMQDSLVRNAAAMGGIKPQMMMGFEMFDRLGDYFERAKIRGMSFGDALKNLSSEFSMMLAGGAVAGVAYAFDALNKSMEATLAMQQATEKIYKDTMLDIYKGKLNDIKKEYDDNAISAKEYKKQVEGLNWQLYGVPIQNEIDKLKEKQKGLDEQEKSFFQRRFDFLGKWKTQSIAVGNDIAMLEAKLALTRSQIEKNADDEIDKKKDKMLAKEKARMQQYKAFWLKDEEARIKSVKETVEEISKEKDAEKKTADEILKEQERWATKADQAVSDFSNTLVDALNGDAESWKRWADNVIQQIERALAKAALLEILKMAGLSVTGIGGIMGSVAGALGLSGASQSSAMQVQIYSNDPATVVRLVNNAYRTTPVNAAAQLSRQVARGQMADAGR